MRIDGVVEIEEDNGMRTEDIISDGNYRECYFCFPLGLSLDLPW